MSCIPPRICRRARFALLLASLAAAVLGLQNAGAADAAGESYLTILAGRSQWAVVTNCKPIAECPLTRSRRRWLRAASI